MKISKVINDLPNEMLLKIFAHLSIEDLALSIQHVSERWHQISKDDVLWRDAVFSPKNTMSNEEIILLLQNVPALKTFSTNSETKLKLILDGLHDSRLQIQHFDLQRSQTLSLTTLRRIVELFPDVKYLTLPLPKMMTTQIKWAQVLGQCKSLISLSFHNRHGYVVKGMLQPIANGCPSLQHIYLGHCEFSADDIQYFLERKKHQLVSFSATLRYTGVFTHLSECSKLEYLHIENNNNKLAYNDIKPLSQLKNLKSIRFLYCTDSIAENLQHFFLYESFSKIIELDLSHNFSIQDFGFNEVLKNLPMIKYLNMSSSPNLGDEGLRDIWRCSRLEHLDISKCALMTDKSVQYVSKGCKQLKNLNISSCNNMTDDAIQYLLHCKELKILKIGFNRLTGIYFNLFASSLVQLNELHIDFCESLHKHVIDKLQQDMPHLRIIYPFFVGDFDNDYRDSYFSVMN